MVERGVEGALLAIVRRLLGKGEVELARGFAEQGGDSLLLIQLVAAIGRELEVTVPSEEVMAARSLGEIAALVLAHRSGAPPLAGLPPEPIAALRALLRPRPSPVSGEVPLIANRYSYFFRRRRDFHHWNLFSRVLEFRAPVDEDALRAAARALVHHHDGLRLQLHREGEAWRQIIVAPEDVDPLVTVSVGAGEALASRVEAASLEVQRGFAFPGELFKIVYVRHPERALLLVIVHHLLVDGYCFGLVLDDLFALYRGAELPPRTTPFRAYSIGSTGYWRLRAREEAHDWLSLPWAQVERVPVDHAVVEGANIERHTVNLISRLPVDETRVLERFAEVCPHRFTDVLLAAIARAYQRWTGQRVLHLATVFHGRESFLDTVDLSRTVGYIAETIPLLLQPQLPLEELLQDTRRQVDRASTRGKSFGVLRHLSPDLDEGVSLGRLPDPELSLNVKLTPERRRKHAGIAEPALGYRLGPEFAETTERGFLISGGVFFQDGDFCIAWDFSARVFEEETIARFLRECMEETVRLAQIWMPSFGVAP